MDVQYAWVPYGLVDPDKDAIEYSASLSPLSSTNARNIPLLFWSSSKGAPNSTWKRACVPGNNQFPTVNENNKTHNLSSVEDHLRVPGNVLVGEVRWYARRVTHDLIGVHDGL